MITQKPIVDLQHLLRHSSKAFALRTRIQNVMHFLYKTEYSTQFRFLNGDEKTTTLDYYLLLEKQFFIYFHV